MRYLPVNNTDPCVLRQKYSYWNIVRPYKLFILL